MSLATIVEEIRTQLVAINGCVATIPIGDEYVEEHGEPPRIVVVPSSDDFSEPVGPGGNPRPIRTRNASAEVVLWGVSRDYVEGMIDQFVIALHRACKSTTSKHRGASYVLGSGAWTRKTNLTRQGFEYRLAFTVQIPIVDRVWTAPLVPEDPPTPPLPATYEGVETYPTEENVSADVDAADEQPSGNVAGNVTFTVPVP